MNLNIKTATVDDISEIYKLIELSVKILQKGYYTESAIQSGKGLIKDIDKLIASESMYIAVIDGQIVGCGGILKNNIKSKQVEFKSFFVHPGYSRKGIGSSLLKFCLEICKKQFIEKIVLSATLSGVPLYEKFGFKRLKTNQILLSNGEFFEVVEMERFLLLD